MNKIFSWSKKHWLSILLIIITITLFFNLFFNDIENNKSYKNLFQQYKNKTEEHQKQINELRSIQETERKEREKQYVRFVEEIKRIEEIYSQKINQIEKERVVHRDTIVEKAKKDPTSLTKEIKDTFGIPIVIIKQ